MSDEELEAYIKTIEPNFNSHLEKGTIEMSNEYFNLLEEKMARIINKNQSLKKQLENCYCNRTDCSGGIKDSKQYDSLVQKVENQQKEFISYLENEKDRLARECSNIYEDGLGKTRLVNEDIFNEVNDILQKYKSTIGDDK